MINLFFAFKNKNCGIYHEGEINRYLIDWGAFKFTLPPPYLESKLRKSTTHIIPN